MAQPLAPLFEQICSIDPSLYQEMQSLIQSSLDYEYAHEGTEFQDSEECEDDRSRIQRVVMVRLWIQDLKREVPEIFQKITETQAFDYFTKLFYIEWSRRFGNTTLFRAQPERQSKPREKHHETRECETHASTVKTTCMIKKWETLAERDSKALSIKTSSDVADPVAILNHMLNKTLQFHQERYSGFFKTYGMSKISQWLQGCLRQEVLLLFKGGHMDPQSLKSLGGDLDRKKAGVYMHIIWDREICGRFFLYVGQSRDLAARVDKHSNPYYRSKTNSLHYYVLQSGDMGSTFVLLGTCETIPVVIQGFVLNLLEMWAACLFQTLQAMDLEVYIPEGIQILRPGCHLNVVLPLWQSFSDYGEYDVDARGKFSDMLLSEDKAVREFAKNARRQFYELRNSQDATLRDYYYHCLDKSLVAARLGKMAKTRAAALESMERTVLKCKKGLGVKVSVSHYDLRISRKLVHLEPGAKIQLKIELHDVPHPYVYTQQARDSDPSNRLAVWIEGKDRYGNNFGLWLRTRGLLIVKKMNTFVDEFDGLARETIEQTPRRWISRTPSKGQSHARYT